MSSVGPSEHESLEYDPAHHDTDFARLPRRGLRAIAATLAAAASVTGSVEPDFTVTEAGWSR